MDIQRETELLVWAYTPDAARDFFNTEPCRPTRDVTPYDTAFPDDHARIEDGLRVWAVSAEPLTADPAHYCADRAGYNYHLCSRAPDHDGACRCGCGETWTLPI